MRQGPHKNRSRSRGRRPAGNQSGRVYESNGPDVKVRGTAQTVADKYLQLARDAHSAGDPVMAEGYFQHAEHYLRIVAASQPFQQQPSHQRRDDYSYDEGDEGDDEQPSPMTGGPGNGAALRQPQPQQHHNHAQPQSQSQPQTQPQDQPQAQPKTQAQPDEAAIAPAANDGEAVEQPWGGPEPEFLRRGPANGSARSRRPRQPRGSNGRGDSATAEAGEDAAPRDATGQDVPDQT